jgi:hypothetical protein
MREFMSMPLQIEGFGRVHIPPCASVVPTIPPEKSHARYGRYYHPDSFEFQSPEQVRWVHGENSKVSLADPTPKAYREVGRFTPPDQPDCGRSKAWAYPVVANGRLFVRDLRVMWRYGVKNSRAKYLFDLLGFGALFDVNASRSFSRRHRATTGIP